MASPESEPSSNELGLKEFDDLLHCGICFDYFNIAMIIPQCSHNYCSLCIRKFLSYKTQCPICCVTVTESDLRNNRILDDLVKAYVTGRKQLSQRLLDSSLLLPQNPSSGKLAAGGSRGYAGKQIKRERRSMDNFLVNKKVSASKTESSASPAKPPRGNLFSPSTSAMKVKEEPHGEEQPAIEVSASVTPSTSMVKVKVECPVCGVGILEQFINKHLDGCLTRDEKKDSLRSSGQKRKPITKVVYNLLSERDLRKRLKEVGLSTHGSKQQLIKRHQEFVHLFNSQCDSLNPKSAEEIVTDIEKNEKIRSTLEAKQETGMTFSKKQSEEEITEIHQEYRKKHKMEFQQLIEQVKSRWKPSKRMKEDPVNGDRKAGDSCMEDIRPDEESIPDYNPSPENTEASSLGAAMGSAIRSNSPVFPLSPQSRASSSSDILRDIEEAAVRQESSPTPDTSGPETKKQKVSSIRESLRRQQPLKGTRKRK